MTTTRKTGRYSHLTSRRHEAYTPATPTANGFFADLGSCGTRSLGWADAHDPTPAAPADATCLWFDGVWYFDSGKVGTRIADGRPVREFEDFDGACRLWVADNAEITRD